MDNLLPGISTVTCES